VLNRGTAAAAAVRVGSLYGLWSEAEAGARAGEKKTETDGAHICLAVLKLYPLFSSEKRKNCTLCGHLSSVTLEAWVRAEEPTPLVIKRNLTRRPRVDLFCLVRIEGTGGYSDGLIPSDPLG
jgi:hypothetical protein